MLKKKEMMLVFAKDISHSPVWRGKENYIVAQAFHSSLIIRSVLFHKMGIIIPTFTEKTEGLSSQLTQTEASKWHKPDLSRSVCFQNSVLSMVAHSFNSYYF